MSYQVLLNTQAAWFVWPDFGRSSDIGYSPHPVTVIDRIVIKGIEEVQLQYAETAVGGGSCSQLIQH